MGVVDAIVWVAVTVRLYLHLLWLAVNREARTSLLPPRKVGRLYKKVLLLGDGNVFGVGDWVTMGSAAGPVRELQRLVDGDDKIRTKWTIVSAGHHGATSDEWSPECTDKPAWWKWTATKPLWKDMMANPHVNDADVVVLLVGGMDGARHSKVREDPAATARNVVDMCRALHADGKVVCVCSLPATAPGADERNTQLRAAVKGLVRRALLEAAEESRRKAASSDAAGCEESKGAPPAKASSGTGDAPPIVPQLVGEHKAWIMMGPDLAGSEFKDAQLYCWDGYHYSSKGHKAVATELYSVLAPRLKVLEFQSLADVLAGGLNAAKTVREQEAQAVSEEPERSPAVKVLRVGVVIVAACLGLAVVLW